MRQDYLSHQSSSNHVKPGQKAVGMEISFLSEALLGKLSLYGFGLIELIGIVCQDVLLPNLPGAMGT